MKKNKYKYLLIWLISFVAILSLYILLVTNFPFKGGPPMSTDDVEGWIIYSVGAFVVAFIVTAQIYFSSKDNDEKDK